MQLATAGTTTGNFISDVLYPSSILYSIYLWRNPRGSRPFLVCPPSIPSCRFFVCVLLFVGTASRGLSCNSWIANVEILYKCYLDS
jgi:hypothetical protein